jgi:hypothetical protein
MQNSIWKIRLHHGQQWKPPQHIGYGYYNIQAENVQNQEEGMFKSPQEWNKISRVGGYIQDLFGPLIWNGIFSLIIY